MRSYSGVVMAALVAALAAARPQRGASRMELAEVVGHTVCPLKVLVDEDPLRLPRRIKYLTCDRAVTAPAPACCGRRDQAARCVELYDNVLVEFLDPGPGRNTTHHVVQVPVGCACVLLPGTAAQQDV